MTRYEINSRNEIILKTRTRIDDLLSSWEETKIGKIEQNKIPKLFENPITAIAYSTYNDEANLTFEFDKKDIIRAIDFWINDRIQENERRLLLKGTLRDVDEKELKELVTLRQRIDKDHDKDSKYGRYRKSDYNSNYISTYTVEFYKITPHRIWNITNSNSSSRYYNFTNNLRDDGARFDFSVSDEVSIRLSGGDHRNHHEETEAERANRIYADGFPWIHSSNPHTWRIRANDNIIVDSSGNEVRITGTILSYPSFERANGGLQGHRDLWDRRQARNSVLEQRPSNNTDPSYWVVRASLTNNNEFRVVDEQGMTIASGFSSSAMASAYIRSHRQNISIRESMAEMQRSGLISREELRDAFGLSTPSLRTEPAHPSISIVGNHTLPHEILQGAATPPLTDRNGNFVNVNVQELYNNTYEDMICLELSGVAMGGGSNTPFVAHRLQLSNQLVTIDTEIYTDNRLVDELYRFGARFDVRLLDESHILIDHNNYNMISYTVTENLIFDLVTTGSPRRFNNMRIQRFSQEHTVLGGVYTQCSVDLVSIDDKCSINDLILEDTGRTLVDVLRRLSGSTVNVAIFRHKTVVINGYSFVIHAPMNRIEVQYSNH